MMVLELNHFLKVSGLSIFVSGRKLIDDFNHSFCSGMHYVIVGPSGVGKTSLLECIGFLRHPDLGTIEYISGSSSAFNSKNKYRSRRSYWNNHLSFQFQDGGIVSGESVLYNVTLSSLSKYRKQDKKSVQQILHSVNLDLPLSINASRLSGGEKRRLALARSLYFQKNIFLFDEPTTSLDEANKGVVIDQIRNLVHLDKIVISATHDPNLVESADCLIEF